MSGIQKTIRKWKQENRPKPNMPDIPPNTYIPFVPMDGNMEVVCITREYHNVQPIGMSYWRNINQHAGKDILDVVLSIGNQLTIFTLDKRTLDVINERPLGIQHTGEGVNYSRKYTDILYYGMNKEYFKFNTSTLNREVVWSSSYNLWQCHMDYAETTFSGTLKDDNWQIIGWGVNGHKFPLFKRPDECQVDKSGEWLCIKEIREDDKLLNRFIYISTGAERVVHAEEGAIGHSDCGFGYILGENSFSDVGGAVDLFDLKTAERRRIFNTGTWNLGYVSCTNARPDKNERFLVSSADGRLIICGMHGSSTKVCAIPAYYEGQPYEDRPKANQCPNGEYAIWTDKRTGKLEAYIVRIPR